MSQTTHNTAIKSFDDGVDHYGPLFYRYYHREPTQQERTHFKMAVIRTAADVFGSPLPAVVRSKPNVDLEIRVTGLEEKIDRILSLLVVKAA